MNLVSPTMLPVATDKNADIATFSPIGRFVCGAVVAAFRADAEKT
jgi:hypothetical protein